MQTINGVRPAFSGENAYGAIINNEILKHNNYISLNGYLKFEFLNKLSFNSQFAYENATTDNFRFDNNQFGAAATVDGRVSQSRNFFKTLNAIQTLNYKNTIGIHTFKADAIFESYEFEENFFNARGTGFLPNIKVLNGSTSPESVGGSINKERLLSVVGRINYNYNRKYVFEASFRRDGSSKFSRATRWGTFFSAGGSWVLSNENFIKNIDWINRLKLKASYGELGNNRGIGFFPYLQVFDTGFNQLSKPGVLSLEFVDPNLSWEKTAHTNIGVEFSFFENKIIGSIEYYNKESIDLIYDQPLALSTGNESVKTNVGAVKNSGLEFSFESNILSLDYFQLNLGLNFSLDKNRITELTQDEFIDGNKKWQVGKSLFEFYMPKSAGVDFIDGYQMWYKDVVTDQGLRTGEQIKTKEYSEATRYYTGKSSIPAAVGGFSINSSYKNFDLSALFNFSFGSYVYDGVYASLMNGFETAARQGHTDLKKRWRKPGDITDIPLFMNGQNDFNSESTRFLFKNDYIRLRGLNIGYNFNQDWIDKLNLKKLRIFFQGDNIFTYQSHKGIDPEQALSGQTDNRSHQMKTYALGVNIQL
ncbi:SusC/RagA family TonB-linked outer membrane protein [Flavobacteriaceae bacterium]|nr:SusC/RagA family TonB-linked outer membrane protein [Flavobacteriaceae bacterium]